MEIDPDLLKKYVAGSCSSEERNKVAHWLNQQEAGVSYDFLAETDTKQEKAKIVSAVNAHISRKKNHFYKIARIAAIWLVISCAGYYAYHLSISKNEQADLITISAAKGKKKTILLPDGSKVYLNSGSILRFSKGFTGKNRLVNLNGEAFFEVAPENHKPFIVVTSHTTTQVLGTSFNLKSFKGEKMTYLTVEEGRVRFSSDEQEHSAILGAHKHAIYQEDTDLIDTITAVNKPAWKEGYLIFQNERLSDIIPTLERWYDIQIQLTDPALKAYRIRGRYHNPNLQTVLDDLSYMTNVKVNIQGKQVTIHP